MWNQHDILDLIDYTIHDQQYVLAILRDDPNAHLIGNPVREMIINSVLDKKTFREIWQFDSLLTAEEICDEWERDSSTLMDTIREAGILIYDTIGKKIRC